LNFDEMDFPDLTNVNMSPPSQAPPIPQAQTVTVSQLSGPSQKELEESFTEKLLALEQRLQIQVDTIKAEQSTQTNTMMASMEAIFKTSAQSMMQTMMNDMMKNMEQMLNAKFAPSPHGGLQNNTMSSPSSQDSANPQNQHYSNNSAINLTAGARI
jgi:hypothetical protein